jgi:hypothetical protein
MIFGGVAWVYKYIKIEKQEVNCRVFLSKTGANIEIIFISCVYLLKKMYLCA